MNTILDQLRTGIQKIMKYAECPIRLIGTKIEKIEILTTGYF